MSELRVVMAEGVIVGPNDRLLILVPRVGMDDDTLDELTEHLERMGLGGRSLVLCGDDVEFKVVQKEAVE